MSAAKDKGTKAETAVVRYLQSCGYDAAERRALRGTGDAGDVIGLPGIAIEVKNVQKWDLAGWLDEAIREAAAAGVRIGAVWHKRPRKTFPGEWYVTMSGEHFVKLLDRME